MDFSLPLQQSSFYRNANFLNFFIRSLTTSEQTEAALDRLISATINFSLSLSLSLCLQLVVWSSNRVGKILLIHQSVRNQSLNKVHFLFKDLHLLNYFEKTSTLTLTLKRSVSGSHFSRIKYGIIQLQFISIRSQLHYPFWIPRNSRIKSFLSYL